MAELELYRQKSIENKVPQLIEIQMELILPPEETTSLTLTKYENCLSYSQDFLLQHGHLECSPVAVAENFNAFLERYQLEQLREYGEAIEQLASVILNEPLCERHVQRNIQWRVLEFMLFVNYKVFKWTKLHPREMEEKRKTIMESLAKVNKSCAYKKYESPPAEAPAPSLRYGFPAWRARAPSFSFNSSISTAGGGDSSGSDANSLTLIQRWPKERSSFTSNYQSEVSRFSDSGYESDLKRSSFNLSLESAQPAAPSDGWNKVKVTENFNTPDAKMNLTLNLMQGESAVGKPTEVNYMRGANDLLTRIQMPCWQVDVHVHNQPRMLASSFNLSYGKWLLHQLRDGQHSVRRMSEEQQVVRELVILFFASEDSDHFQWRDDGGLEMRRFDPRTCNLSLLPEMLDSLKQMRHLRELVDMHAFRRVSGDHLETLTSFSVALRRLLRPLVEFIIHFERRLVQGKERPTFLLLSESFKKPLDRLKLLYELSQTNQVEKPSVRSLMLLHSLFVASSRASQLSRAASASLLLHSLQAYCQFLDSWWTTGEFSDWHDEFPYHRIKIEGRTEYELREEWERDTGLLEGRLFQVIRSHVNESRQAVAILYDSRRLGDFISLHGARLLKTSLHNSLMEAVLQELTPYQTESVDDMHFAPDILQQLKDTDVEPVRQMFYAYHTETLPDPRQPAGCSADELMRNFQACAPFAPLTEIVCLELERLLRQRSLLANAYVSDLLRNKLQVHRVIVHLRSVFLLLRYELLRHEFEVFFRFLKKNLLVEATCRLREIVMSQDRHLGYLFQISVKGCHPDNVTLRIMYDPLLNRVINQGQVEQLNECFRLILNLYFTLYERRQLPALKGKNKTVKALKSLRAALDSDFEKQLSSVDEIHQLCIVDFNADADCSLEKLHQTHKAIVQQVEKQLHGVTGSCRLEHVLHISKVLKFMWQRAVPLIKEQRIRKPQKVSKTKEEYLRSILKRCWATEFLLKRKYSIKISEMLLK